MNLSSDDLEFLRFLAQNIAKCLQEIGACREQETALLSQLADARKSFSIAADAVARRNGLVGAWQVDLDKGEISAQ